MRRFQIAAVVAAVAATVASVALLPRAAEGATASANFQVQATVIPQCAISATALNFGNYDPNAAAPTAGTSTITLTCTRNTGYSVALSAASGFAMSNGAGSSLNYSLFQANGTTPWTTTPVAGVAPSRAPIPLTVNGSIAAGQDVPTGSYTDTVVATVTF
jgi:spore coat protein U-like protein